MKYWAYINSEILGPYEKEQLLELSVFSASALICPQTPVGEKTEDWKEASSYPEIAAMMSSAGTAAPVLPNPGGSPPPPPAVKQITPAAGSLKPVEKTERSQPVFNTEMPDGKLKSISLHSIDQTPPAPTPPVNGADFEINRLNCAKVPQTKEEPQPATDINNANSSASNIPQADAQPQEPVLQLPQQTPPKPPETELNHSEIPANPAIFTPAPSSAATSASEPFAPLPPEISAAAQEDKKSVIEIPSPAAGTPDSDYLTKRDLEPLIKKISQIDEVLSSIKGLQSQHEITDKIQYLEKSLADIKISLAKSPPASGPQPFLAVKNSESVFALLPARKESLGTGEPKAEKQEIIDQGSSGKTSGITGIIGKSPRFLIGLIFLAAAAGCGAFVLKYYGVPIPFLSAPASEEPPPAQQLQAGDARGASTQEVQLSTTPQEGAPPAPVQAEPARTDLSPEIIIIGKAFAAKEGGTNLETRIYEDAAIRKGDFKKTTWQVKELPAGMFELNAVIPAKNGSSRLIYSYEIDYAKKTVKPLDEASAKPLDALLKGTKSPKQKRSLIKKNHQGTNTLKSRQPRPVAKSAAKPAAKPVEKPVEKPATIQIDEPPAAATDEEYKYVYEDEVGGTEE
jgi:hypothetical protein